MPTVANMPSADVQVTYPNGKTKTVFMPRLLVQTQNAEFKRDHGMFLPTLAKLNPTVRDLRKEYEWPSTVRTWEQAAHWLRLMYTELSEHIASFTESD